MDSARKLTNILHKLRCGTMLQEKFKKSRFNTFHCKYIVDPPPNQKVVKISSSLIYTERCLSCLAAEEMLENLTSDSVALNTNSQHLKVSIST